MNIKGTFKFWLQSFNTFWKSYF